MSPKAKRLFSNMIKRITGQKISYLLLFSFYYRLFLVHWDARKESRAQNCLNRHEGTLTRTTPILYIRI
jgi:hypothetical protein